MAGERLERDHRERVQVGRGPGVPGGALLGSRQELALTGGYNQYFYGAARAWCKGTSIGDLLEKVDISEGDLVMTFNKTLDIMRQVRDMLLRYDPESPLRLQLEEAGRMMRRGVVEIAYTLGFAPTNEC